ncbi:MAG: MBL fold metallo-hydrolase [Chitinophagaceae bacterium]|nr:MBL fold metallo-hydrolase [Rubrivivax sp.]
MTTTAPPNALPAYLQPLGHGVHAIDTGFHRDHFDAAYLLVHGGRAAFIDTGTNFAVPRLLASLDALGLARDAVDWVIPTHVHLDRAAGALWQGALAVYGQEEMERSYGRLVGVPAERVDSSSDGMRLSLAGRELRFADTPGHARHHHCIWDATSGGWFTGDTFGLSYREFDLPGPDGELQAWILPTSTPVQFDPPALLTSIDRLMATQPQCMYLTHYGRVAGVPRLATLLREQLAQTVALAEGLRTAPDRHDALKAGLLDIYAGSLTAHGSRLDRDTIAGLLAVDIELNAQGIAVWLER